MEDKRAETPQPESAVKQKFMSTYTASESYERLRTATSVQLHVLVDAMLDAIALHGSTYVNTVENLSKPFQLVFFDGFEDLPNDTYLYVVLLWIHALTCPRATGAIANGARERTIYELTNMAMRDAR